MNKVELKINHLIKNTGSYMESYKGHDISYITQYLLSLGIKKEDVPSFIDRPRDTDEDNPFDFYNMKEGCEVAWNKIVNGAKCFVVVDSDCDGYTSASILINYLTHRFQGINVTYALHPGKEHGIVLNDIPEDAELIFVPDAGSNNYEEQKTLISQGKTVIILDHHEVDNYENTGAILINNQFSKMVSNKSLSGAGVVYMFCKAMDSLYFPSNPIHRDYMDLAAIGIIADAMNMTTLGNNYIAYYGLRNIKSPFIRALAEKQAHGINNPKHLTKINVAFYIAPVINGVIRSGTPDDKDTVFKAMSDSASGKIFESDWRGTHRAETLYDYAARIAANAKSRQDAGKKKAFEWLCGKIKAEGHADDNLIIAALNAEESKKVAPTITGLIAMELVKEFNRPALVLRETDYDGVHCFGGSGRNGNFYGLPDLKKFLNDNGAYYAEGHANAFGAFLLPEQVEQMRNLANAKLPASAFEMIYEVDYLFNNKYDIDYEMLYQMATCDEIWGNSLPQPKFGFTIDYSKTDIFIMGKDRSSVKIKCGDISFVAFKNAELAETLLKTPTGTATIVGRAQINEWQGNVSVQIVIDDIDVVAREEQPRMRNLFDLI